MKEHIDINVNVDYIVNVDNYVHLSGVDILQTLKDRRGQSRQQRRIARTKARLKAAARSVFSEKGLGASVDEITERADLSRGIFYYHFNTKERLINQLLDEILSELIARMNEECSQKQGLESVLDGIIEAHISFFSNRRQDFVIYYQGRADLTLEKSREGLDEPFLKYAESIGTLIDLAIPESISAYRIRRTTSAIAGFISGYYSFASIAASGQDIDEEFRSLRRAFVTSLARFTRNALPGEPVNW
jgi:AcrR family transcriptional regulator